MSSIQGARLAHARRELIKQLKRAGALTDASAQPLDIDNSLKRTMLKRMLKREVIRQGTRGGYWLDEERYAEWKRQNLIFAIGIALVLGGIFACLMIYEPKHPPPHAAAADSVAAADSAHPGP